MGLPIQKPFIPLNGIPILAHTLSLFNSSDAIFEIVLVVSEEYLEQCERDILKEKAFPKIRCLIPGGETRQDSVYQGFIHTDPSSEMILVHDGVRPFLAPEMIPLCIEAARLSGGALVAVPMTDTVKKVDRNVCVEETLNRKILWRAQTPQVFQRSLFEKAYKRALDDGFEGTDESSLVERLGIPVRIVEGKPENIKITTQEDLVWAQVFLNQKNKKVSVQT